MYLIPYICNVFLFFTNIVLYRILTLILSKSTADEEPQTEGDAGAAEDAADALNSLKINKDKAAAGGSSSPQKPKPAAGKD